MGLKTVQLAHKFLMSASLAALLLVAGCQAQQAAPPAPAKAVAPAAQATSAPAPATQATKAPAAAPATSSFPTKAVEFVAHTSPGDGADIFMRTLADILQKEVGVKQSITVVNKVGGSGAVMFGYVASKAPDPHFVMPFQVSTLTTPLRYDTGGLNHKSFTPIALLANDEMVVAVRSDSPYKDMKDLVAAAKKQPKAVNFGGGVLGGSDTIVAHMIERATDVKFNQISFKGNAEAMIAMLGGNADFVVMNPSEAMGQVEAKKARLIAVGSPKRLELLPDVPTIKEQGIDVTFQAFRGLAGPKGIPQDALNVLQDWARKANDIPTWKKYIKDNALTANFKNSEELGRYMEEQDATFTRVLKEMSLIK